MIETRQQNIQRSEPRLNGRFTAVFAAVALYLSVGSNQEAQAGALEQNQYKLPPAAEKISQMTLGDLANPFRGETAMLYVHKVRAGENLGGIAKQFLLEESRYKEIMTLNGIENPSKLKVGQALYLILQGEQIAANFDADVVAFPSMDGRIMHLFSYKPGKEINTDILLNSFYPGIDEEQKNFIKQLNRIGRIVPAGKSLWLPWAKTGLEKPTAEVDDNPKTVEQDYIVHKITSGQTLTAIAIKYFGDKHRVGEIAEFNGIKDPGKIKVGQEIKIPIVKPEKKEEVKPTSPKKSPNIPNRDFFRERLPKPQTLLAGNLPAEILNGVDPFLVQAIIQKESVGNPNALGQDGEIGLMQIKPSTAKWIAEKVELPIPTREELFNPRVNIKYGTAYFAWILKRNAGNVEHALMEYNMGPGDFAELKAQNGGDIPSWEVPRYAKIVQEYRRRGVVAFSLEKENTGESHLPVKKV